MNRHPLQWSVFMLEHNADAGEGTVSRLPVLVVSRESANDALPVVTVLPLVGKKKGRRIYPNETWLPSDATLLDTPTVLMAHQIRTIPKDWLATRMGSVDDAGLRAAVRNAVRIQLDLDADTTHPSRGPTNMESGI